MANTYSILGVMPTVPGAVSGNFSTFTINGIIQDSGLSPVTNFVSPSNLLIPTSLAVSNAIGQAITGYFIIIGNWNASTNSPTLADGVGTAGNAYVVTVAGTQNLGHGSVSYGVGDTVYYGANNQWNQIPAGNTVTSVNAAQGAVVIATNTLDGIAKSAYGASFSGVNLYLQSADATYPGLVNNTTQVFSGNKTFQNSVTSNSFFPTATSTVSNAGSITLTKDSNQVQVITGTSTETFVLPDATTLNPGAYFLFNNNSSGGSITVNANGGGNICTVARGAWVEAILLTNSIPAGTWDYHAYLPSGATFGNTGLTFSGGTVSFANGNFSAITNQVTLGASSHQTVINAPAPSGASVTFTIPAAAATNSVQPLGSATANNWVQYIDSNGVQNLAQPAFTNISGTIANNQTSANTAATASTIALRDSGGGLTNTTGTFTANTNQLVLGTSNTYTMTMAALSGSKTLTLPNASLDFTNTLGDTNWTPADGSGAGLSLTITSAKYARILNMVFFSATVVYPSTASGSVGIISGLPVASNIQVACHCYILAGGSAGQVQGIISASGTSVAIYQRTAGTGLTNASLSLCTVVITGSYFV